MTLNIPLDLSDPDIETIKIIDHRNNIKGELPRAQSFTSLMAEVCQNINRGVAFSRCLNGKFPCRKCSVKA